MSRSLRRVIEQSPAGTQFTREGLLAAWEDGPDQVVRWVGIGEAHAITDMPEGTLRSGAPKWATMQEQGSRPPIRVRKKGPSGRSPWLFDEGDCFAMRRTSGGGPRKVPRPSPGVDEREAVIQHWAERVSANL